MNLLREYIRNLLSEQANPTLDKIVKLVKTGHEGQAFELMLMMPEELDATTVVTRIREELVDLRAITRPPESGMSNWASRRPKTADPEWDEFAKFARAFSNFVGHEGRMLDPDNWNPHHRARHRADAPPQKAIATTDRWPSVEDMIQALQQRIDEAE